MGHPPGDLLLMNNYAWMHGRDAFQAGGSQACPLFGDRAAPAEHNRQLLLSVSPRDSHSMLPTIGGGIQTPELCIGNTNGIFKDKAGTLTTGAVINSR